MGKVLGIVRASTERQEVDSQKKELRDYLSKLGYSDGDMVFIEEQGASARKCNKKYLRFLEDIKTAILSDGEINAVGLWSLNRLGRVESKLHEMKEFFVKHRIQVYCKEPNFKLLKDDGTEDTAGGMMFSVYAAMVKLDTDEMMAKMVRGKHRNSKVGKFNGGIATMFGYKVNEEGFIVVNAEEASLVQLVFKMYSSGKYSIRALARELNERGIKQRGKAITHDWIKDTLNNPCYVGKESNRKGSKTIHPRIIEQDLWDKRNEVGMGKFKGTIPTSRERKNCHLCVGLIKCQYCGSNFSANGRRYVCVKHTKGECGNTNGIIINALDPFVYHVASILEIDALSSPNNNLVEELEENIKVIEEKIAATDSFKSEIQSKKSKVGDLYVDGIIDKETYKKRLGKIDVDASEVDAKVIALKKDLETSKRQLESARHPTVEKLCEWVSDLEVQDKMKCRELVRRRIKFITINDGKVNGLLAKVIRIYGHDGSKWVFIYRYKKRPYQIWMKDGGTLILQDEGHSDIEVIEQWEEHD